MGKICTFCKYNESKDKCGLIESMASVKYTERCTYYEPVKNVAPVIHAHWKPSILPLLQIDWFRCSNCNANAIQTPFDIPARTEFCPSCGAKMDEEVNNG